MTCTARHRPTLSRSLRRCAPGVPGFSLVELLVVIAVLAILLGIVWKGGSALVTSSRTRDTQGLFQTLEQAVQTYKSEVDQKRIPNAEAVYNGAPPDDLAVFHASGSSLSGCSIRMAAGSPRILVDGSPVANTFPADPRGANGRLAGPDDRRFGDARALALAMRLRSPKAAAILDRIDSRFKKTDDTRAWMYDPGDGSAPIPLVYFVDAWGTPIEYYSTTKTTECGVPTWGPRVEASTALVKANNGDPVFVSYGPNGPEQLSNEFFSDSTVGDTTIVADFWPEFKADGRGVLNLPLNQDNVYSSETVTDKMSE